MREIKFRGRMTDTGEWVYGCYVIYSESVGYIYGDYVDKNEVWKVDAKTVGQFTGLHDKNGREIYEGDIVRDDFDDVRTIKWFDALGYDGGGATHSGFYFDNTWDGRGELSYHNHMNECEIIGNIHENAELLA